jgi:hypothetical protein
MSEKEKFSVMDPDARKEFEKISEQIAEMTRKISFQEMEILSASLKPTFDVLTPIIKAEEALAKTLEDAQIKEEDRKRIHHLAKSWASWGLCPPAENTTIDEHLPPRSEQEVDVLYQHFRDQESPEAYCQFYLDKKEGPAYECAKEAVDDYKRGDFRSCAAMLFALIDGELLRQQPLCKNPKNSEDFRLLPGPKFYVKNVRNKKKREYWFTFLAVQCFYLAVNHYYQRADDFKDPETKLEGLRAYLDHGMLLKADGLLCFKIFTLIPYCDYSLRWAFRSENEEK